MARTVQDDARERQIADYLGLPERVVGLDQMLTTSVATYLS